jgi:glycosyltransferase involved in cell wall biosynthesis
MATKTIKTRLVYITTAATTANVHLRSQLAYMREQGFDVVVISSPGDQLRTLEQREKVSTISISMEREIRPLKDLLSLVRLYRTLRRLRPTIVNAGTPKAGLLGMIAAWSAGVPVRIYLLHGLRLETASGLKRLVLGVAERCTSHLAHRVICVSESLRQLYITLGFTTEAKTCIVGEGSVNGIDVERFSPSAQARDGTRGLRAHLGIPDGAPVIGFVGRFTRDKGVPDLLDAFDQILGFFPDAHLLMLGDFEDGDPIPESYAKRLCGNPRVVRTGIVADPPSYYPIMDVLAFPSYREGYPIAPLEAAAAQIPTVAFKATGTVDAVCDGVTGTIVPLGDVDSFARAVQRYLSNDLLRLEHGKAGRERARRHFRPEMIWESLYAEYAQLLKTRERALSKMFLDSRGNPSHSRFKRGQMFVRFRKSD